MVSTICLVGSIQATLLSYIIISKLNIQWIPLCLTAYTRTHILVEKIIKQTRKTKQAIVESFSENNQIFYYDDSISKLPCESTSLECASQIVSPVWSYKKEDTNNFVHLSSISKTKKHLPYLSSELTNGQMRYSLSDWMETVRICSDTLPPLRIIVSSWAIDTKHPIDLFNKDNPWKFNVITEDGDELSYDVVSGEQIDTVTVVDADAEAEAEAGAEAVSETT
jgi:hypothetical protein